MTRNVKSFLNRFYQLLSERCQVGELYWALTIEELEIVSNDDLAEVFATLSTLDKGGYLNLCFSENKGNVCVGGTKKGWKKWQGWTAETLAEVMASEAGQDW